MRLACTALIVSSLLTVHGTSTSAAIVEYRWTGGGAGCGGLCPSYYLHQRDSGGTAEVFVLDYDATGSGSFTVNTAHMPGGADHSGGWSYDSTPGAWITSAYVGDGFPAPNVAMTPTGRGALEWQATDGTGLLVTDASTYVETIESDGSTTFAVETRYNILFGLTVLDTFVIDGVVLPWLFDFSGGAADSFLSADDYNSARFDERVYERWSARLYLTNLEVYVDGLLYTGDIDPPVETPEPAALALLGLGIGALALRRRISR
jgi:PEP-CTERM motif